jgi:hypothetical protein
MVERVLLSQYRRISEAIATLVALGLAFALGQFILWARL